MRCQASRSYIVQTSGWRALLSLLCSGAAYAAQDSKLDSGTAPPPEQSCYDVLHYDLSLRVDPVQKAIQGRVEMRANWLVASSGIALDLDERLSVTEVLLDGIATAYERRDGRIFLKVAPEVSMPGSEFIVSTSYAGTPREAPNPPWSGGFTWAQTASGAPWIATSCQGEGADLWWPCKDQPDDEPQAMDLHITVPAPLVCATNGRLLAVHEESGLNTYHWRVSTPINAYSVALNIAPYRLIQGERKSVAGDTFPVYYYVLPENYEKGLALFQEILADLAFFEEVFGPYPFRADKYGVAETPHLGMEHQTITAYGNNYVGNPWGEQQGFDFLLHHEMAHEYWALLVTAKNWNDFWIHEGFGTYAQALYAERLRGQQGYRQVLAEQRRNIRNRGALAPREARSSQEMYFTSKWQESPAGDIYYKGSWVLHTLRYLLGDEAFFPLLRRFAYPDPKLEQTRDGSACRFATTDELLAIAERETKRELDWFFELYLRQAKLPKLESAIVGGKLRLRWETPSGLAFPMPVEIEIGGELRRVELPNGSAEVDLAGAMEARIDPHDWILRESAQSPR